MNRCNRCLAYILAVLSCFVLINFYHIINKTPILTVISPIDNTVPKAFFKRPKIAENLDCPYYFEHHFGEQKFLWEKLKRINFTTPANLLTECEDILARHYFPDSPGSKAEANFPIAFARIVYRDYYFLEMELAATYAPQNFYCYSIDKNATPTFKYQMYKLSRCLPNVYLAPKQYPLNSRGKNMNLAHFECIKMLANQNFKYLITLHNHDVAIKTNAEMVQILTWLNGANDVMLVNFSGIKAIELDPKENWTFAELKLFKNASRNSNLCNNKLPSLDFARGLDQVSLSKAMITFMTRELDLREILRRFNTEKFACNEILFSTLQATEALQAPGGFPHRCIRPGKGGNGYFTRRTHAFGAGCMSGIKRHEICIMGLEDLPHLKAFPELFINKMMPTVDFGAYVCWVERMFERSHLKREDPQLTLNATLYLSHPAVRYQIKKRRPNFKIEDFECSK